jgi:hypothetical protein
VAIDGGSLHSLYQGDSQMGRVDIGSMSGHCFGVGNSQVGFFMKLPEGGCVAIGAFFLLLGMESVKDCLHNGWHWSLIFVPIGIGFLWFALKHFNLK